MANSPFYRGVTGPSGGGRRGAFGNDEYDGFDQLRQNISDFFINQSIGGTAAASAFHQALAGVPVTADKFLPAVQLSTKSVAAGKLASRLLISGSDSLTPAASEHVAAQAEPSGVTISAHEVAGPGLAPGADAISAKLPGVGDVAVGGADLGDSLRGLLDLSMHTHPGSPAGAMRAFLDLVGKLFTVAPTDMINSLPDFDFYGQAMEAAEEFEKLKLFPS